MIREYMIAGITGGAGHLGGALTRELLNQGIKVRVLVRKDKRAVQGLPVEIRKGDILDPGSIKAFIKGCTHVFHCAALISLEPRDKAQILQVNIEGTDNVIRACGEYGVERLIHFSTIHALNPYPIHMPVDEKRDLITEKCMLIYDYSKAEAERHILKAVSKGLDAVIINPTGIIGPYDFKPSYMGRTLLAFIHKNIIALINGGFNWVDVRDVAKSAYSAALKGRTGERYIISGSWCSIKDLALLLQQVSGCTLPKVTVPMWLARIGAPIISAFSRLKGEKPLYTSGSLYALQHYSHIINHKAIRELGYTPTPLLNTISDTYGWFKQNEYIKRKEFSFSSYS